MIARRTILKAIGMAMAAPATAPASMSVGAAAASLGVAVNGLEDPVADVESGCVGLGSYPYDIIDAMFARREQSRTPNEHMPHHIRSKKSWSPAFKHHVFMREEAIMQAVRRRIHDDEDFRTKVGQMLGLKGLR